MKKDWNVQYKKDNWVKKQLSKIERKLNRYGYEDEYKAIITIPKLARHLSGLHVPVYVVPRNNLSLEKPFKLLKFDIKGVHDNDSKSKIREVLQKIDISNASTEVKNAKRRAAKQVAHIAGYMISD